MKMKYLIISIKFIFFTILLKSNFLSQEEKRIALVIGNSNYEKGVLKNPINDAKLISATGVPDGVCIVILIHASICAAVPGVINLRESKYVDGAPGCPFGVNNPPPAL